MKVSDAIEGDVGIFELSGKIMGGDESTLFFGKIREYLNYHKLNFVIDMKDVLWSNSLGLGMLIAALATVKKADGQMVLANVTNVQDLLAMTQLIRVFETYDSREEAMQSFAVTV